MHEGRCFAAIDVKRCGIRGRAMKVKLIELNPLRGHRKVVLGCLPAVLGRSRQAEVPVNDQWVSRRHCQLEESDGVLVVRDLGSKHGTYVNGIRVSEARVMPEDKLTVGLTSFVASYRGSAKPARGGQLSG